VKALVAVTLALVLSGCATSTTTTTEKPATTQDSTSPDEAMAAAVVAGLSDRQARSFCHAFYAMGSYHQAFVAFRSGFTTGSDHVAHLVFDGLVARCG